MQAKKDPDERASASAAEVTAPSPPRTYDCAGCRFVYDERTGLCDVCIRRILDAQAARKAARRAL